MFKKLLANLRRFFQPSESKLRAAFRLGQLSERNKIQREQPSFPGVHDTPIPDVPTIDLAKQPVTEQAPYVPGTALEVYRRKRGLKTIKLEPFPWLEDDSWLNSGLLPIPPAVSPVYELPEKHTGPIQVGEQSALHQLLDTETLHKVEAVRDFHRKRHERK